MNLPKPTHDVRNQAVPLADYNSFVTDTALREAVAREGAPWATDELVALGETCGSAEMIEHGRLANAFPPTERLFDRYGHRVNQVLYHPSYHHLMKTSCENGIAAQPWTDNRPGSMVTRLAKSFLMGQVEQGHGCPITMTFAVVPALKRQADVASEWLPRATAWSYDGEDKPADQKQGCILGMAMTEKQGGSDVRANSTTAVPDGADHGPGAGYRLVGHKWFCSAPMSDAFLTLAHTDKGLSCFIVPRWAPDGTRNPMWIQRLKDKVGNKSNASSEIEYHGAWAQMVGEQGRGVRTIIDMVQHTRLDCVTGSASQIRHATAQAIHHAHHRSAFGRTLVSHPLMKNLLADLQLESEAATAVALRLGRAYDEGQQDAGASAFARIATAVSKYHICKRTPSVVYEAMEAHGGNGYVDDGPMGRLYRDAPLNSIWEGSGNVIALDVLRAMAREPEATAAFRAELSGTLGANRLYDAWVAKLSDELADGRDLELRGRRLVERMALALQASVLLAGAPAMVSDAFIISRLGDEHGNELGTLAPGADFDGLIARGRPVQ
ncbi:MAG: acyl-CoA dehydrogenase family protein [Myxococcales bacterium]|nr:acyl-CoA dehydrogenase family protein [Myxococcales bacterium]